ncbi:D-altritol 5-dehydrogenase [Paenibacillus sp. CECT 9249]|uniref:zinc-dependent alcohol dehydrogenase family protein n=1 Tax=Paenibacillus sp. CECT 9249 TaxID=2845385 RepID=UPI001E44B0FA|nr:zinc-dependent alcohol dehydrogenase family protein [Paenibacillus sp. CECT 9249]CAH0119281.1 D-altritol 5-dehydrogenase [Paenibacillus sp. CECT 9249]
MTTMKALVFEAPKQAKVKEVPYPKPKAGEITIKVENVGICGTDIHIFEGEFISPYPIIPGHEFAGTVYEVGEGVSGFQVGERVSADPTLYCGECPFCLTKRTNQCANWGALGNTVNGSMAEFVAVPARNAVKLPDDMTFAEGAFIEPMACVVHAMNRLSLQVGDRVILFGAGAMGQQLVQALVQAGASELVVVDVSEKKLETAVARGATKGVLSRDIEQVLHAGEYPYGFDVVVDATGIPAVIEQAFNYMGPASKYLQFGVTATDSFVRLSPFQLYNKDWTLIGSMAINQTFLPAFHWLKEKRVEVASLISRQISLEEAADFFEQPKDPHWFKVQLKL